MLGQRTQRWRIGIVGAAAIVMAAGGPARGGEQALVLKPEAAVLWVNGAPQTNRVYWRDHFEPGMNSVLLVHARPIYSQLRWTLADVPEGDYTLALRTFGTGYFCFGDGLYQQAPLYHNDRRVPWTPHERRVLERGATRPSLHSGLSGGTQAARAAGA